MPFKHIVDHKKKIVVLKSKGKVSTKDIVYEIQEAINTKRGEGIARRLIDMTDQEFSGYIEDAGTILKMIKASARVLGSRKIAVLFKAIPDSFESGEIILQLRSPTLEIEFFIDNAKAIEFLNKPSGLKGKG